LNVKEKRCLAGEKLSNVTGKILPAKKILFDAADEPCSAARKLPFVPNNEKGTGRMRDKKEFYIPLFHHSIIPSFLIF
jgi:hypothetical protein